MTDDTYADGAPLEVGDALLLQGLEEAAELWRIRYERFGLDADCIGMNIAMRELKRERLNIMGVDCEACDDGYVRTEDNLSYGECGNCYGRGRVMP